MQHPQHLGSLATDRLRLCLGLGQQQQSGDLVLILVGHQLVQVPGDRLGELRVPGRGHPVHHFEEPIGVLLRLVADEVRCQAVAQRRVVDRAADSGRCFDRCAVGHPGAAPRERGEVLLDRDTVQLDRPLHRERVERNVTRLQRHADHEHVDGAVVAEQALHDPLRVDPKVRPRVGVEPVGELADRVRPIGVDHHRRGRDGCGVGDQRSAIGRGGADRRVAASGELIERDQDVDRAGRGLVRTVRRRHGHAHVADHRPGLLGEPGLVESAHVIALQHRGGADDLRRGHHARPADARQTDRALVERRGRWRRHRGEGMVGRSDRPTRGTRRGDVHERRAVALLARQVEVARVLIDAGLAPERGLDRLHRQAVALVAAVAASLTHAFVDDHTEVGCADLVALPVAALLRRAPLVVEQHRAALHHRQVFLGLDDPAATPHPHAHGQVAELVATEVVGGDDDLADTDREEHLHERHHVELAEGVLAAGHRHSAVVEHLVRDVRPVGHGRTDGAEAGVEQRAVADVLEQVLVVDERRHPEPLGPLVAHRGEADDVAHALGFHHQDQRVAADAGTDECAVGNLGGGVVRAPRTEVRRAIDGEGDELSRLGWRRGHAVGQSWLESRAQPRGDDVGVHRAGEGEQRRIVGGTLAHDHGMIGAAEERVLHQPLEVLPLLLDDDDLLQALGELADLPTVERHRHAELEQANAGSAQLVVGAEPEEAQRLHRLLIGLAGGDDADPVRWAAYGDRVEVVEHAVLAGELEPDLVELALHLQVVRHEDLTRGMRHPQPSVDPHRRHHGCDAIGVDLDGAGAVRHGFDDLDAHPHAACARHRDGVAAEIDRLLDVARVDDRHVEIDQRAAAGRWERAALRGRVVAHERDRPALVRRAGERGVAKRIARPIQTRCLAVPDADDAVVPTRIQCDGQLRAHHRRGGELLVHRLLEQHPQAVGLGELGGGDHVAVVTRQRAARVAGDVRRSVQPGAAIGAQLLVGQAGERL